MAEFIVSENSWPLFLYEKYTVNRDNLEEGLLKSKLLVLVSGLRMELRYHSSLHYRLSRPFSRPLPLPKKPKEMVTVLTSLRTTGALGGNQTSQKLRHVSPQLSTWAKSHLVLSLMSRVK